jgi:exodeoxyribonuclease-5
MILAPKQDAGIVTMSNRYKSGELITTVAGFAGTGKSTIINHFIEGMDLMKYTAFVTFTGKASLVLQRKGLPATTIHKLIYNSYRNQRTGKFFFSLKSELEGDIRLIVIDEVSMVSKQLLRDLMSFGIPIVALGDPGQLEPIGEDNGLLKRPDVFLDEIHRQAQDNTIILLSMLIRQQKPIPKFNDDFVKVIGQDELNLGMFTWADQIICGRNNTRRDINNIMRKQLDRTGEMPEVGDKMICLRNYWDFLNEDGTPLINGTLGTVSQIWEHGPDQGVLGEKFIADFTPDFSENEFSRASFDANVIKGMAPMAETMPPSMGKLKQVRHEFDYGYAITCHKSQGSEFDNVFVYEEMLRRESHARWLYTAVTRAAKKLVIYRPQPGDRC